MAVPSATPEALEYHDKTLAGTWVNDYGSVMTLTVTNNQLSGFYQSSTGSTGRYEVTGYQSHTPATSGAGQPVALAIAWHSIEAGLPDPSWNWSSGLSGQLSVAADGDVLSLAHLLVASSDFPGLTDKAVYVDKLIYRRTQSTRAAALASAPPDHLPVSNSLNGTWVTVDGATLELSVHSSSGTNIGHVKGSLRQRPGDADIEVSGFTDINAVAGKLSLQSVTLTAAKQDAAHVFSLSGSLQLNSDELNLLTLTSTPTTPGTSYLTTKITSSRFLREPTHAKP